MKEDEDVVPEVEEKSGGDDNIQSGACITEKIAAWLVLFTY